VEVSSLPAAQSGVRTRGTERLFLEDTNLLICKIYAVQELNKERLTLKEMKSKLPTNI
jgi:hypothetical protein